MMRSGSTAAALQILQCHGCRGHQGWLGGRVHPRLVAVGWAKAQQVYDCRCNCTVICPPPPDAFSEELLLGPGRRSYTWECHAFHAPARGSCACSWPACSLVHVLQCKSGSWGWGFQA